MKSKLWQRLLIYAGLALATAGTAYAQKKSELSPYPNDMSVSGLRAVMSQSDDPTIFNSILPVDVLDRAREYARETYRLGKTSRSGSFALSAAPLNVRANNPAGDAVGETQSEVAIAVFGDTVVVGWNDSKGFTAGFTISSYAYSTNGGATFTDGGNVPLQTSTDQAFGDPGIDTDEKGNWYYNQIYTKTGQQNIGVHHGKFVAGILVWDTPVMASIGTTATGNLDKCLLATDRVTSNVYVAYTRFTAIPQIEVVRSTTKGLTWDAPIILDNTTTPTSSKQAARPFCGPGGEVYVVWEKGANTINCPDGSGNVANSTGIMAFTRSLNNGVSYDPFTTIGTIEHSWTWSGPGDLRERANEFPDIAVDRSGGPNNGNIYVTWHESAPWTSNLSAGSVRAEADNTGNNNPGTAELFVIGENVTGSSSSTADLDYWQFSATQGQSLLFNLDPQGFNCGVTGTSRGMRMRLFATQSPYPNPTGFPDSLLAASALGAFAQRIVWTAPKTGTYLVRLQPSTTAIGTYTLRVRDLTFGAPSPARDSRDVVIVRSTDDGLTWSAEQRINDDAAGLENRRPFITTDALGHVHVFWHDSRTPGLGSNAALTSIFGTTSRDGGATWTPNYVVTDELSFFSFNTRAVPNLGDYNQAAATNGMVYPAWSDQRLSTGDVRTPGTNTFTAGLGPETYTAKVSYDFTATCPPDTVILTSGPVGRAFKITNNGSVPDKYGYTVTDVAGLLSGPTSGTTGTLQPGGSVNVIITITAPNPVVDELTFTVTPVGDTDGAEACTTKVTQVCGLTANAGADQSLCIGQTIIIGGTPTASGGTPPYTYSWAPTTGLDNPAAANPKARTTSTTTYTVTVTDATGCQATDQVKVTARSLVFLADGAIKIAENKLSSGNIRSNDNIEFGKGAVPGTHAGNLTAKGDITIDDKNKIIGNAIAGGEVNLSGNATVTGTVAEGQPVEALPLPSLSFTAGTVDVTVPKNGVKHLAPGSYDDVTVQSNGKLFLTAGNYFMDMLDTDPSAVLNMDVSGGPINIHVVSELGFDSKVKVFIIGTGVSTDKVSFITLQSKRLEIGKSAMVQGAIIAANAEVHFGASSRFRGSVCAEMITLDSKALFSFHSTVLTKEAEDEESEASSDQSPVISYQLEQNYPNPFNPSTMISFALPEAGKVTVKIFNESGQLVRTLVEGEMATGSHQLRWNGRNESGKTVAAGVYLYQILVKGQNGNAVFTQTRRMTFLK